MATINITVGNVSNTYIVLYNKQTNTSTQVLTTPSGSDGVYSFTNLATGLYSVYNTGIDTTGQNPPTLCGFPKGFTGTAYPRRLDFNLNASIVTVDGLFNYDKPIPWTTVNGGLVPNYGIAANGYKIDLITGAVGTLPTDAINGFGYNIIDNLLYCSAGTSREGADGIQIPTYPIARNSSASNIIGDVTPDGYYICPNPAGAGQVAGVEAIYCLDVNPYRTSYLRWVTYYPPHNELPGTDSPAQFVYINPPWIRNICYDWSYLPSLNAIVSAWSNIAAIFPLSGAQPYTLPVTGQVNNSVAIDSTFSDPINLYLPSLGGDGDGNMYKYTFTPTVVIGSILYPTNILAGDGARGGGYPLYNAQASVVKSVTKSYASSGDILTYTVTIVNGGNTTGLSNKLVDTLPSNLTFVPNSLYFNGAQQIGANPNNFNLGALPVGGVATVSFSGIVSTTLAQDNISNTANISTASYDIATQSTYTLTFVSNTVNTQTMSKFINISKSADKLISYIGDTITYTLNVTNTSTLVATQANIVDNIPLGLSFINNSLNINGSIIPNQNLNSPGYSLGTIPASYSTTITFKAVVVSIPSGNVVNNIGSTNYNYITPSATISFIGNTSTISTNLLAANFANTTKLVNKVYTSCGDTLTYTIIIPNSGNTTATNVILVDTLPTGTTLVNGSIVVNNVALPSGSSLQNGINIGTIPAGGVSTVTFQASVTC